MPLFPGSAIPTSGAAEYTIDQSLRFEDGSSAYLSRTPASAGNRRTWTWSGWVKRGNLSDGNSRYFFSAGPSGAAYFIFGFTSSETLSIEDTSTSINLKTSQIFRDPSAWYHLILAVDTTQATSSDRIKVYVNGSRVTDFGTSTYPSQNSESSYLNTASVQYLGRSPWNYFDGYLSEVHFIDGQALTPDSFGEVDETYGHWKPIEYTGTYGTNGFYLPFSGTFYNDASGNGNNWTANNLATTDVVLDSPTNNFSTLNPLKKGSTFTLAEGNLYVDTGTTAQNVSNTFGMKSGKWYWEMVWVDPDPGSGYIGISTEASTTTTLGNASNAITVREAGNYTLYNRGSSSTLSALTPAQGDILGIALNLDDDEITFYENGTILGSTQSFTNNDETWFTHFDQAGGPNDTKSVYNFGQDSSFAGNKTAQNNTDANGYGDFYYAPPSGFLALCTANLPDPAVVPGENFNTVLYTGNDVAHDITGVGFQPDFVWVKSRSNANGHRLADSVRGATKTLFSNFTYAEDTADCFDAFVSDGFTVGTDGDTNGNAYTFVSWNWKADNTSGSSNTDGSITSTVAANPDAGFSIVSYTGNASAGATVGHGLSQAPEIIILKDRDGATNWSVYHASNTSAPETDALALNTTDATSDYLWWNDTAPTSSVFSLGAISNTNASGNNFIAYCFHSVDGFSKFGSYTGNGSTDGPFVYTGFRPAFVMVKNATNAYNWQMYDNTRETENPQGQLLLANSSSAEIDSTSIMDFTSNGFKIKELNQGFNESGSTIIYMAFAEHPFKFTNAR